MDASLILESELNDHHEDAIDHLDVDGLQKVLNEWISDQKLESYDVDYSKKIRIWWPNEKV